MNNDRRKYVRLKARLFALLGKSCVRCGFSDPRALQVDHINGCLEARDSQGRSGRSLYKRIVQGKVSHHEFQILCANCNWIKKFENKEVGGYRLKRIPLDNPPKDVVY